MSTVSPATLSRELVELIKQHDLYAQLPEIVRELQAEVLRNQEISVISAEALPESEQKSLAKTLIETWGEHPIVFTVDPVILSGLIVKFQDKIIDMSGRGKLTNLAQELK